jgi:hypothetical protein
LQKTKNWTEILILVVLVPSAGLFLLSSLGLGLTSLYRLTTNGTDPAGTMIASCAAGFEGILIAFAAWSVFQSYNGREREATLLRIPFASWHILILFAVLGMALLFGAAVSLLGNIFAAWLVLPLLTLLLIVIPIWILLGLGTMELDFGPRWRAFTIFGLGLTLNPLIIVILEILLLFFVMIGSAIFALQTPGMADEIIHVASLIQDETDPEVVLETLAPFIVNPAVVSVAFGFLALAVPMIEELIKPLGVWIFARKINTPAQGFALGLLSGAAYALFESLGASGQGNMGWAFIVTIRAGTSLLHIITSGLMGWAIVAAFHDRRYRRLLATYLVVILIHGIWNGSAVGAGFAVISDLTQNTSWSISVIPAALCGLTVLTLGMVALLVALNRRVRKLSVVEVPDLNIVPETQAPKNDAEVQ